MGLILATAKIPGMSKGEQGVKTQFKSMNLLISPEPLKQLCIASLMSLEIKNLVKNYNLVYFIPEIPISNRWGVAAP